MMKRIFLALVLCAVFCSVPAQGYEFPTLGCLEETSTFGLPYYQFARHYCLHYDENYIPWWRVGLWEPDQDNDCDWGIPFVIVNNEIGSVDYAAAFEYWDDNFVIEDIYFRENYEEYMQYRAPNAVKWIQCNIYTMNHWIHPPNQFGDTTVQLYDLDGISYRLFNSILDVLGEPSAYTGYNHTADDVFKHEIGHSLVYGFDIDLVGLADGMFIRPVIYNDLGTHERAFLHCVYSQPYLDACDINVASKVSDFWVDNNLTASWKVLADSNIRKYAIEGWNGEQWVAAIDSIPPGAGDRSVSIPGGEMSKYRLVEHGFFNSGEILCYASPGARVSGFTSLGKIDIDAELTASINLFSNSANAQLEAGYGAGSKCVILGPTAYIDTVRTYTDVLWDDVWGYELEFLDTELLGGTPEELRSNIKEAIEQKHLEGADYFVLVGGANDYIEFQSDLWDNIWWSGIRDDYIAAGWPAGGYPERDIIPTWYYEDTGQPGISLSRITPYWYSDFEYSDTNEDNLPDVSLSRWPVVSIYDLKVYIKKMYDYSMKPKWNSGSTISRVAFFVGDVPFRDVPSDYDWARRVKRETMALIPSEAWVWPLFMSEIEDLSTLTEEFVGLINNTYPNLVLSFSNGSNEYSFGGFVDHPSWDIAQLDSGNEAIYLGATCLTADFARGFTVGNGPHLFEDFLFTPERGAVFWIGPTNASWQGGNEAMLLKCVEEIYKPGAGTLADCFVLAQREALVENEGNEHITNVAKSYSFLGDPLSPFRGGGWSPVDVEDVPGAGKPNISIYPNPFNPRVEISLTLPTRDTVVIDIFDIKGRHIKTIYSGNLEPGEKSFFWNGKNGRGQSSPAGVYFVQINSNHGRETKKMLLVK